VIDATRMRSLSARILRRACGVGEAICSCKRFVVYAADLNSYSTTSITAATPIEFRVNAPEAFAVLQSRGGEFDLDEPIMKAINRQLTEGEICVSGWVGTELAYYGWVQFKYRLLTRQSKLPIPAGTACIYKCFTRADFRGKQFYTAALAFTCRWLARRGYQRVLIDHFAGNSASKSGILRSGMQPAAEYRVVRLLGFRWGVPNAAFCRLTSNA
jgi:hypothetical protein